MSRSNRTSSTFERPEPISDRNHVMKFGKYRDLSLCQIIEGDPKYLLWLHENTDFELHWELLEEVEETLVSWKP